MRDAMTPSTICPTIIGRTDHLANVGLSIERTKKGSGGLILISGEAGIGKSRLLAEAKIYALAQDFLLLQGNCFLMDVNCPYAPLLDLWRSFFAHLPPALCEVDVEKIAQDLFPLLPELVSVSNLPFLPADPEQEKRRLFAVMKNLLLRLARQQPVLFIIEDLHWSDDTSLDFLHVLARISSSTPLLLLITFRSDEAHPPLKSWLAQLDRERLAQEIQLTALSRNEVDAMLSAIFVQQHTALDMRRFLHGELDTAHPAEVHASLVGHIRRIKPDVVVTFGQYGGYGHPDHIAISQFTTAAIVEAASANSAYYLDLPPHQVAKLYYMAETEDVFSVYQSVFGELVMQIDGAKRTVVTWPDWSITTLIDTCDYWRTILRAISCHQTQLPAYYVLENLSEQQRKQLWSCAGYYRVFSLVNGGREVENDLFTGLR